MDPCRTKDQRVGGCLLPIRKGGQEVEKEGRETQIEVAGWNGHDGGQVSDHEFNGK